MKRDIQLNNSKFEQSVLYLIAFTFPCYAAYTYLNCINRQDWLVENILVLIFVIYLVWQYFNGSFRWQMISYLCFYIFLCLHEWGAQYTYSEHPFGEWLRHTFHLQRNGYDRLVHTMFGVLMYLPTRQYLHYKMRMPLHKASINALTRIFLFASIFEIIEFMVGNYFLPNEAGHTYVGTQGDVWDAHKDIMVAFIGASVIFLLTFMNLRKLFAQKVIKQPRVIL